MSKNIQSSLIRYNGDIGPTILDVDDKTDGPDGTTKPLTKEMLQQMIVANFPELQNVKDADVKTELELIKQQQSEILQRLNQPIDTQLTGSNVVKENMKDVFLPGGSYAIFENPHTAVDGNAFGVGVLLDEQTTFDIRIYPMSEEGLPLSGSEVIPSNRSLSRFLEVYEIKSKYNQIRLYNTGENDVNVRVMSLTIFNAGNKGDDSID